MTEVDEGKTLEELHRSDEFRKLHHFNAAFKDHLKITFLTLMLS